jgi:hypothetical protein
VWAACKDNQSGWITAFGSGPVAESKGLFCGLKLAWMAIPLQSIKNLTMRWHLSIKKFILNDTLYWVFSKSKSLIFVFKLEMVIGSIFSGKSFDPRILAKFNVRYRRMRMHLKQVCIFPHHNHPKYYRHGR